MPNMQQIGASQASPEVPINENFVSLEHQAVYAKNPDTTTGLTWGYLGGRWGGFSISAGTLSLTDSATNYVVIERASGAASVSTSGTNWADAVNYLRVYKLTTSGGVVTATEDHRAGPGGVHGMTDLATLGGIGKHAVYVSAGSITPSATGGCAALATVATSSDKPDLQTLNFDSSSAEYAQFSIRMPESWDEGTLTFRPVWSHPSTTTNFGVVWGLQAVAVSDDDTIAASYGTAQTSTDTGGTTDDLYIGPESSAITVGGSPAAGDMVFFRVYRNPSDGSDTMAVDARLHGMTVYVTTSAATDA